MQYIAMKRNNGFFLLQCTMKGELVMNQEIASKIEQLNKIVGDISKNCNCIIKRNQQIEKEYLGDSMGRFLGKTATALAAGWNIGNKFITPLRLCHHEQKTLKNQAEKLVKNCGTLMSALLQCRARVKNANSDLQSALKKLETEEYKGLEKRRKKIKKRIKELNALEQEIASMNKAISSVYAVTKKWLN